MKLTMLQFVAFCFMLGWVGGQVVKSDYNTCLILGSVIAFIGGYIHDAHKLLWACITKPFKR